MKAKMVRFMNGGGSRHTIGQLRLKNSLLDGSDDWTDDVVVPAYNFHFDDLPVGTDSHQEVHGARLAE